ncbi:MAG: aminodeoxychorismate/anthranilate synthase component II [Spirochaetaceae bacterium]|jgi:anthranilate synthase component 2|nr:aminodeoxychorismate/anthranilate synthase component II [Spirochaetaceae bacterium]
MILLIDNYDSFSYNLYQMIGGINLIAAENGGTASPPEIKVVLNDAWSLAQIEEAAPSHIVLSPGPGKPGDAGICEDLIRQFAGKIPIFGVCLGHQAICEVFGATVSYAKHLMHGKSSQIMLDRSCPIFKNLPPIIDGARYHSLAAEPSSIPETLVITAHTRDNEIMAVAHRDWPVYGVQFHPESILTPEGAGILSNFLACGA